MCSAGMEYEPDPPLGPIDWDPAVVDAVRRLWRGGLQDLIRAHPHVDRRRVQDAVMDDVIESYDQAWNASTAEERRRHLEKSLTDDCELIEPRGRFTGRLAILDRITGFSERFPGARVDITTNIDEHHGVGRYGWRIVDPNGRELLEGIDVVERDVDGRLRKVVMFFGPLEPS